MRTQDLTPAPPSSPETSAAHRGGGRRGAIVETGTRNAPDGCAWTSGTMNFIDGQGNPQAVTLADYDSLCQAIRRPDGRLRGWKLVPVKRG